MAAKSLVSVIGDQRHRITWELPRARPPLENNQHQIIKKFLAGDYDFWLSLDSDMFFDKCNPLDLIDYDRDIIGVPYPIWYYTGGKGERPYYYSAYNYINDEVGYKPHDIKPGLQRVDAIGGGCFLISRRVFLNKEMQKGAFARKYNEDGTVEKGNDISFCERAREQGFEIYTHGNFLCDHVNEVPLYRDVILAMKGLSV
jgi:GT2 family glycosyltransferase